jgi:hypothetical protein
MQSHRQMSKSNGAECRSTAVAATLRQVSSLSLSLTVVAFLLATVASVALAAGATDAERATAPGEEAKTPAPEEVMPPDSEEVTPPDSRIEEYRALMERIEAEKAKPLGEQDYKAIKTALTEIVNDKSEEAKKAARYARHVLKKVEGYELVMAISQRVRLQQKQLDSKMAGIERKRTAKLAQVKDLGRFAVTGEFQPFVLYGDGHYRIVDDSGNMLCYALPSDAVSQRDLTWLIGRKVGIVGTVEPHLPTKKAWVQFSEIVPLQ